MAPRRRRKPVGRPPGASSPGGLDLFAEGQRSGRRRERGAGRRGGRPRRVSPDGLARRLAGNPLGGRGALRIARRPGGPRGDFGGGSRNAGISRSAPGSGSPPPLEAGASRALRSDRRWEPRALVRLGSAGTSRLLRPAHAPPRESAGAVG